MVKENHFSAVSARRELVDTGYVLAFSPPGTPERWQQPLRRGLRLNGSVYTVARLERLKSTVWEIVKYPRPTADNA